jgi:hypothetical protein
MEKCAARVPERILSTVVLDIPVLVRGRRSMHTRYARDFDIKAGMYACAYEA